MLIDLKYLRNLALKRSLKFGSANLNLDLQQTMTQTLQAQPNQFGKQRVMNPQLKINDHQHFLPFCFSLWLILMAASYTGFLCTCLEKQKSKNKNSYTNAWNTEKCEAFFLAKISASRIQKR